MIAKDIRVLLGKLNHVCTKTLESGISSCVNMTHYELTWEHIFLQLLENTTCDIFYILQKYSIDSARVKKALIKDLETLPKGNNTKPAFSPTLVKLIERSWSLATLVYGSEKITSGIFFVAAQEKMQRSVSNVAGELRRIDAQNLQSELTKIVAHSPEQSQSETAREGDPQDANEILNKYCKNFTQEARDGKIDQILGRDDEIRQVIDIFSRRRKNNPILVGEAGVGKTAIIEGLALRVIKGDVPDTIKNVEVWELDMGLLQAGASVKGEFEKRLKSLIDIAKKSGGKIILFIDEAHTLIGAGGSEGMGDAANLLKPALARGELRTCAATTWLEYRKYFEKDPALTRRFQMIKVEEPDEEKAFAMLRGISESYEKYHNVHITDDGIKAAVSLSNRYISGRQLPDKAIDVLDTASTRVKMSRTTTPASLDNAQRNHDNAKRALKTLKKDETSGIPVHKDEINKYQEIIDSSLQKIDSLAEKWDQEKKFVDEIIDFQKKLSTISKSSEEITDSMKEEINTLKKQIESKVNELEKYQGDNPMVFPYVSSTLCADVIADWTGIPVGSMVKDEAKTLLEIGNRVSERVIGQNEGINQIAEVIKAAKSGMGNPDAPLGVFLCTGPSGVGKTECALALADILFGGEKFSTIINMSEYQEKHTVSQLKGSPPGYVGYGEGGILTEGVRQKPYSIVILDEVEKAHTDILNMFYQVFDKGFMRDGEGRDINFKNTVILMTSNLGSETILDTCSNSEERPDAATLVEAMRPELTNHFKPALLARCRIVPFYPLETEAMKKIVVLKLNKIVKRLKKIHDIDFEYSEELIQSIAEQCSTIETGARNIDAVIDQTLLPSITNTLLTQLSSEDQSFKKIHVSYTQEDGFSISFD